MNMLITYAIVSLSSMALIKITDELDKNERLIACGIYAAVVSAAVLILTKRIDQN